jgi:hypothetical protein
VTVICDTDSDSIDGGESAEAVAVAQSDARAATASIREIRIAAILFTRSIPLTRQGIRG